MHPAPPHASDALTRAGVSLVVPAVAVAAHGIAAGGAPHAQGVLVSAGIGGLFAQLSGVRRQSRAAAIASTTVLLTIAQVACHWAMTIGDAGHGAHTASAAPMLLTHAVAIPLSAVLLILAATLADLLTSSIRALSPRPTLRIPGRPRPAVDVPVVVSGPMFGGPGVRGPPVSA